MSIYGNLQSVNEGLFLSKEIKPLIDEIKRLIKELDYQGNFKEKVKKSMTSRYDKNRVKKIENIIKSKIKKVHITEVITEIVSTDYGASTYYIQCVNGLIGLNKSIQFTIYHNATGARIYYPNDYNLDSNIPSDIFEKAINIAPKSVYLKLKNNFIRFIDGYPNDLQSEKCINNLVIYIENNYPNRFDLKINKFTYTIKIKEK